MVSGQDTQHASEEGDYQRPTIKIAVTSIAIVNAHSDILLGKLNPSVNSFLPCNKKTKSKRIEQMFVQTRFHKGDVISGCTGREEAKGL